MLSEISQREKDKYCILSFICVIEKNKTIRCMEQTRNRLTVTENKLIVTKEVGREMNWEIRIDPYILSCVRQIARRKLRYSTRSSGWCSVLTGEVD